MSFPLCGRSDMGKKNPAERRDSQGLSFSLFLIFHFRQLLFQRVNR